MKTQHNDIQTEAMYIKARLKIKYLLFFLLTGATLSTAFAQFEMKKHTINSGGTTMTGGSYEMKSSLGQTDANNTLSGGNFSLNPGFWQENSDLIFKNRFE